jgi:hypothetical protein
MKRKYNKFLNWTLGTFNVAALFLILFFQPDFNEAGGRMACCGGGAIFFIIFLFAVLLPYVCLWKIFVK